MASFIRHIEADSGSRRRGHWLFAGCLMALGAGFVLVPGELASKSSAMLHGLCAQRPSHSFRLGESVLPMDARMTGIYFGAAATLSWLALSGRLHASGLAPRRVVAVLAVFVALMAIDGFNALFVDLALPHPYEPRNAIRFVTGGLAGTALGVALGYLFAISIWRRSTIEQSVVSSLWQLAPPLTATAVIGAAVMTGLGFLYAPVAIALVVASIGVFWVLATVLLALVSNRAWAYDDYAQLTGIASAGLVAALVVVVLLASLRFMAETYFGLPNLS